MTKPTIALEMKLDGTNWTDVTTDMVGNISGRLGILGHDPKRRTGQTGSLQFELNNTVSNSGGLLGYYSPGNTNARSGFNVGLAVRLKVTFENLDQYYCHSWIPAGGITVIPGQYGERRVKVRTEDWMGFARSHELELPEIATNQAIEDVVQDIVTNMTIAPLNTDYGSGQDTFSTAFDTSRRKTKAMSEINKVSLSEFGLTYVKPDNTQGETLTVEGRYTRNNADVASIPIGSDNASTLLGENGDALLAEDGTVLLADETQDAVFTDMKDIKPVWGKYQTNKVKVTVYPRDVDSASVALYTLRTTPEIAVDETLVLRGSYRDPDGEFARVAGKEMVTPVASTDYIFNTASDGSGSDITSDLGVTADYGASEVEYTLVNNGTQSGFVTLLQARGKGIYLYEPVDRIAEDTDGGFGTNDIGTRLSRFDMLYQDDIAFGKSLADVLLSRELTPRGTVEKVAFDANRSEKEMMAFLRCVPGDRFTVSETMSGISNDFFINGIDFTIRNGKFITYTWYPAPAADASYWLLGTSGAGELGETTYIGW